MAACELLFGDNTWAVLTPKLYMGIVPGNVLVGSSQTMPRTLPGLATWLAGCGPDWAGGQRHQALAAESSVLLLLKVLQSKHPADSAYERKRGNLPGITFPHLLGLY